MNAERNYKIAEMEYEELLRLDNKILTESELEELQEHELVTYWENVGSSSQYPGATWYDVFISEGGRKERIDVFTKHKVVWRL